MSDNQSAYKITSFNYKYHHTYGSPIVDQQKAIVNTVALAVDGLSAKLKIDGMRLGFIHQIKVANLKAQTGEKLLHDTGYYTLNEVPGGMLKSKPTKKMEAAKGVVQYKRTNEMPLTWVNGVDRKIGIGTKPGLKYDVTELVVERNQKIELTFNNNDDMLHNLVITQMGIESVDKVGDMALKLGLDGADLNYVPDTDLVLNHTGIVEPGSEEKIYFQTPSKLGEYWIVCTFPGHAASMRAKLIVK